VLTGSPVVGRWLCASRSNAVCLGASKIHCFTSIHIRIRSNATHRRAYIDTHTHTHPKNRSSRQTRSRSPAMQGRPALVRGKASVSAANCFGRHPIQSANVMNSQIQKCLPLRLLFSPTPIDLDWSVLTRTRFNLVQPSPTSNLGELGGVHRRPTSELARCFGRRRCRRHKLPSRKKAEREISGKIPQEEQE
jgi:hypothetical protein